MSTAGSDLSPATPALLVDLDIFEANVAAMADLLEGTGKTVRPHVKTHRTPELAKRQLGGPAVGVTCATVGEAEVMVAAGMDDVFVANEVVDDGKLGRLVALAGNARVALAVDDPEPVGRLGRLAERAGVAIDVLIDVDILLHRCGVADPEEALRLAGRGTVGYHISLDMDWVDPEDAPGVGTRVPGGATYREAHLAMEIIADHGRMTSMDIVEVNPVIDEYNRTAELAVELASSAFGKKIL